MTHQEFISKCIKYYVSKHLDLSITPEDVFIVWSCKTANNSKAVLADAKSKDLIEATLIGSKNLIVYDWYRKTSHIEEVINE